MFPSGSMDVFFNYLSQVQSLGLSLYTYGSMWLMVISFILLVSMLGAIALCLITSQVINRRSYKHI